MTHFGSTLKIYQTNIMSAIYVFLPAMLYDSIFKINLSDTARLFCDVLGNSDLLIRMEF